MPPSKVPVAWFDDSCLGLSATDFSNKFKTLTFVVVKDSPGRKKETMFFSIPIVDLTV